MHSNHISISPRQHAYVRRKKDLVLRAHVEQELVLHPNARFETFGLCLEQWHTYTLTAELVLISPLRLLAHQELKNSTT